MTENTLKSEVIELVTTYLCKNRITESENASLRDNFDARHAGNSKRAFQYFLDSDIRSRI